MNENPFKVGDRVRFVGTRRGNLNHLRTGVRVRNGRGEIITSDPAIGTVLRTWRKGRRHMIDVDFGDYGGYVVYPEELQFELLDTLGSM